MGTDPVSANNVPLTNPAPLPVVDTPAGLDFFPKSAAEVSSTEHPASSEVSPIEVFSLKSKASLYLQQEDLALLDRALALATQAHEGQFRMSGEPYVSHPIAVAGILAQWRLDGQVLVAGLLHDVLEDCDITKEDLTAQFGSVVANLVDSVSKLAKIETQNYKDAQVENYRKMFLAMAKDVRVILIKLADRLHNMRTLGSMRPDKRRRIARETLEIYAPIANRLGLNALYRKLQELAFENIYPMRQRVLEQKLKNAYGDRHELTNQILQSIRERLPLWNVKAEVYGREKNLYSIYHKMLEKHLSFSQVLDIFGFRILVDSTAECYLALGALHELYKPLPGKVKDYIAIPKANGYQSLHTTIIGPSGSPVEVQIRTFEMHAVAESGVASHWLYKDDGDSLTDLQRKTHSWLQSVLELQTASGNSSEFFEHVKVDLYPGEVFVFTPRGKILNLPSGATAVDFAYAVHTDVGNRCIACRINGESLPLRTELKSGDQVEIITAAHSSPNPAWLAYVRTGKARAQVRHFLKNAQQEEAHALGERLLTQALRPYGTTLAEIDDKVWEHYLRETGQKNRHDLLTDIGLGKALASDAVKQLTALRNIEESAATEPVLVRSLNPLLIDGNKGQTLQMAKCCYPIPGDAIIGMLRIGQGLEIHMDDCPLLSQHHANKDRWVDVEWSMGAAGDERLFDVPLSVTMESHAMLAKVLQAITDKNARILGVVMTTDPIAQLTLQVHNRLHLARIMRAIKNVPSVQRITRVRHKPNQALHHEGRNAL